MPEESLNKPVRDIMPSPKRQTTRISLESALASSALDPNRATTPVSGTGPIPQTIRLKKPPTSPLFVKPPTTPVPPVTRRFDNIKTTTTVLRELPDAAPAKRETARIVLGTAMKSPAAPEKQPTAPITGIPVSPTGMPQTIRLRRPPTSALSVKPPDLTTAPTRPRAAPPAQPAPRPPAAATDARVATAPISEAPTVARATDAPRQKEETSRIVLDHPTPAAAATTAAAAVPATAPVPGTPRTIRLKRPADALAVKPEAPEESMEGAKGKTAKIELPPEAVPPADATSSITQRKTIKIKRTERNVVPRTLVLKRPEHAAKTAAVAPAATEPAAAPAKLETAEAAAPAEAPAAVHWSLAATAIAALICAAFLAYVLAVQALAPSINLPHPPHFL